MIAQSMMNFLRFAKECECSIKNSPIILIELFCIGLLGITPVVPHILMLERYYFCFMFWKHPVSNEYRIEYYLSFVYSLMTASSVRCDVQLNIAILDQFIKTSFQCFFIKWISFKLFSLAT